jgi:hypothetical protein
MGIDDVMATASQGFSPAFHHHPPDQIEDLARGRKPHRSGTEISPDLMSRADGEPRVSRLALVATPPPSWPRTWASTHDRHSP